MSLASTNIEKKKINLSLDTYEKLKSFSRQNGLKLRLVIDAMVDVILEDAALSNRVIELSGSNEPVEE
jgi:hypothetical protein